ncbi:hypothetical protein HanOQP8_Chr10g0379401 [Helianthus annuus]|nr:hypothetical protein HanOQP8_Chr10g0379401 [Helianthus annuus]
MQISRQPCSYLFCPYYNIPIFYFTINTTCTVQVTRFQSSFITSKSFFFWSINTSSPFQTHQSNFFLTMAFKVGHSKRKCASLVKQQRGRIYILRRCATMLLCWYIHGDD